MINLFVYGTLKKGHYNHDRFGFNTSKFIENKTLKGFSLVQPKGIPYPFCINDKEGEVIGEVYEVADPWLLQRLDAMEYGAGYVRVEVQLDDMIVHVYVDNKNTFPELPRFKEF